MLRKMCFAKCLQQFLRCYSHTAATLKMPECKFQGRSYIGPDYSMIRKIRKDHIVPCISAVYKTPLLIHEGKMQWLFDHNGKRYLDMFGGIVTVSVGHCHPKVNDALRKQMDSLWHTSNIYMHPKLHEYAEKLASTFPGDLKVVYLVNSGSEANDLAMFLCRLHSKNHHIITLNNCYHGMSGSTVEMTASSNWKYNITRDNGIIHAMNPNVYQGLWGGKHCRDSPVQTIRSCSCKKDECEASMMYYKQIEDIFTYTIPKGHVAGFFAESIQGVGGTVQFPKYYLRKVYDLVHSNGGLCVADEVQTGFGRTGEHFWGFQMHGVLPDIVTVAKGIGNGFPMAAVVTTPKIAQSLTQASHFNTFGGNPLASAAGLSVLQVIEEEKLQENCDSLGTYFLTELSQLRNEFPFIGDVRGKGLMIGMELVANKDTRQPISANTFNDMWEDIKDLGVLIGKGGHFGNVFRIKPPMCITKEDVDFTLSVFRDVFKKHNMK